MFRSPLDRPARAPLALGIALAALGALGGCDERERITAPDPGGGGGDGTGPVSVIEMPAQDTTVPAGPAVFVVGAVSDADGLDSIYVDTEGGVTMFEPFNYDGEISVRFGLPITTNGQSGQVITVSIYGVDQAGERGEPDSRRITVE